VNFLGPVSYNGLLINTAVVAAGTPTRGYRIDRFAPEPPPPSSYVEKRALGDGLDVGDVFLGGRQFGLIVTVLGTSAGDFWDLAQDLFAAFSPTIAYEADTANRGFLDYDFHQPTADIVTWPTSAYPYGIPLRYYMRPSSGPAYALERERDNAGARGHAKQFSIQLLARDPRKYLQTATTTGQFTTANQTAVYRGDYWTYPIITFSLSATGHSAFTPNISGLDIQIDLSGHSSGTWTFDYGQRTLVLAGAASEGLIVASQGYGVIEAGATFKYTNPTGISSCTMTYREAWA
jgi:hypothetical protein